MTPAEKMALEVECMTPFTSNDAILRDEAAALIRRLAGTLEDAMSYMQASDRRAYEIFAERHADALRDVRDIPVEEQP